MAGRQVDYTVHLEADDEITPAAKDAAKALDKLENQGDVTVKFRGDTSQVARDVDQVLAKIDKLASAGAIGGAELTITSNVAQITNQIADLTMEIDQLDAEDPTIDVKVQNIADLEQSLDRLQAKAKELNATPISPGGKGGAGTGFDDIITGADQANSAVANMVGNASQDLGQLAGVSGSAGVAIGQLAEYFTDTAIAAKGAGQGIGEVFKSFAAAAGPIAAIAGAIFLVTSAAEAYGKPAKDAAERTKALADAMDDGGDASVAFAGVLRDASDELKNFIADANDPLGGFGTAVDEAGSKIPVIGKYFKEAGVDVFDAMSKAKLSIYDMSTAMDIGGVAADQFNVQLAASKEAGLISEDQYNAVSEALAKYSDSAGQAAKDAGLLNVSNDEASAILKDLVKQADPLAQMTSTWATLMADMADNGSIDSSATAINQLAEGLGLTREEVIDLAREDLASTLEAQADAAQEAAERNAELAASMGDVNAAFKGGQEAAEALGRAFDTMNAGSALDFSAMASNTVQSFDDIKAALAEVQDVGSKPLVPTTVADLRGLSDESAAVIDSIGGMRDAIQTELASALDSAGGNFDGLREKAAFFNTEISGQFLETFRKMGLGPEEAQAKVDELLSALGLLPEQVETSIVLSQEEEAIRKIELFGGALESLPAEVQARVAAAIDANDPIRAWSEINQGVQNQGAVQAPVDVIKGADTATPAIHAVADGDYDATVDLAANPKPAEKTTDTFTSTKRETDPVKVDANTKAAIATMQLLYVIAQVLQPVVTVTANTIPAMLQIMSLQNLNPRPGVTAVLRDYPSAGEIAARIGVVRVPIDAYVRSTPRITGTP